MRKCTNANYQRVKARRGTSTFERDAHDGNLSVTVAAVIHSEIGGDATSVKINRIKNASREQWAVARAADDETARRFDRTR